GGQRSKATPRAAVAKFAAGGKETAKKDLGFMAMTYGNVYVATVAMGAKDTQTLNAFLEAESYPGTSIIIAYSHCIAHGINMTKGMEEQKLAVEAGEWILFRYDPRRREEGKNPLILDSKRPKRRLEEYMEHEIRFKMLSKMAPERAEELKQLAKEDVKNRWELYEFMASKK
ncbi:MAG: pyruvate:ferredoxin (flavodoxin) oxidoreductase, partial [Planctomycetota bacterium]